VIASVLSAFGNHGYRQNGSVFAAHPWATKNKSVGQRILEMCLVERISCLTTADRSLRIPAVWPSTIGLQPWCD